MQADIIIFMATVAICNQAHAFTFLGSTTDGGASCNYQVLQRALVLLFAYHL